MGATRQTRWRLHSVVVFTLPLLVGGLWLLLSAANDYRRMRRYDDWWSNNARVDRFLWWRARSALRLPRAMALDERLSVEDRRRPLVDLRVPRDDFDALGADPILRAGESVKAWLADGENLIQEVDLRLRGDTSVHWSGEKKTLAIESGRGEAFEGRELNVFSAKEVLAQFAANSMAADFGLLAPPTRIVPVFLNKRFYGMFRHFAPIDDAFLHAAGRLPGNVFRGDTAERGDYFKGLPRELFVNPYIWDRAAGDEYAGPRAMDGLHEFVRAVNRVVGDEVGANGAPALGELFRIVDQDEIARLLALELCVGDPWHISGVHNHFWYEDPADGRLHPIVWDLRTLDLGRPPPRANYNRFWRAALRDPRVFAAALAEVRSRADNGALLTAIEQRVEGAWRDHRDGFEYDALRCGPPGSAANPEIGTPQSVLSAIRANLALIESWYRDARAQVAVAVVGDGQALVDVLVDGRAPVELWAIEIAGGRVVSLVADSRVDGRRSNADRTIEGTTSESTLRLARAERLLPGVRAGERLEPEALHYRFFVEFEGAAPAASAFKLRNALTGAAIEAGAIATAILPDTTSAHPWTLESVFTARDALRWDGEVRLSADVSLLAPAIASDAAGLVIAPGTTVTLDPSVSIRAQARIVARGTKEQPITFVAADPKRPWGTLLVLGSGADGSVFEHVRFSGGSGARWDRIECTGMVCVHGARAIRFDQVEFGANLRSPHALHAARSGVEITECRFVDANATALSLEACDSAVRSTRIERAGKHGLAVRGGTIRVEDCQISDCRGSGVSVGGEGDAQIFNTTIQECERGIEARDRAEPWILNSTLRDNETALVARLASGDFDRGGWPRIVRSVWHENALDAQVDKHSALTVLESPPQLRPGELERALDEGVAWLQSSTGLFTPPGSVGRVSEWRREPAAITTAQERFGPGWIAPEATWRRSGSATSLRIERRALVVRMDAAPGRISRSLELDAADRERRHWLVVEAASTAIRSANLRVATADGRELVAPLELPGGSEERFAFTTMELPPDRYRALTVDFEPFDAYGQLALGGWRVVSTAAGDK